MNKSILVIMVFCFVLIFAGDMIPSLVFADQNQGPAQPTFTNPLGDKVTLTGFLIRITNWLLGISAFLVMVALIVGGIRFVISFGNEQAVSSAKKILTWAVIGLIIITLSYAILTFVRQILGVT